MRITQLTKDNVTPEMQRLYDASFPDNERIPWKRLIKSLSDTRLMYAYYENTQLIGLSCVFLHDQICYLSYLVVEENKRHAGYGTAILKTIQDKYSDRRIVIDIEEVKPSDNYEERKKRKDFYLKAGFTSTGVCYRFFFVDYELLSWNGMVSAADFQSLIEDHWGPVAKTAKYY